MAYLLGDYDAALESIFKNGVSKVNNRTGIQTKSLFGLCCRYSLREGLPIVTRRKTWPKAMWAELIWFLSGSTNNSDLQALGSNIWTPWVDPAFEATHGYAPGCLGPVYGFQLRHFGGYYGNGIGGLAFSKEPKGSFSHYLDPTNLYGHGGFDQMSWIINRIKEDPSCRRILFTLWDPSRLDKMRLPPCHYTYQILIDNHGQMTGVMTQRSADWFIGVPADIQFYAALTMMIAQQTGYEAVELVHNTVDSHIYADQMEAVETYLGTPEHDAPVLTINKAADIFSYKIEDFQLSDYTHGPVIKAPVAV